MQAKFVKRVQVVLFSKRCNGVLVGGGPALFEDAGRHFYQYVYRGTSLIRNRKGTSLIRNGCKKCNG